MEKNLFKINLYSDEIPQKKLKDFVDSGVDIYTWCTQLRKPVLITDIYDVFPSLENWTPEFLNNRIGDTVVNVNTSETGVFVDYHRPIAMSLKDYSLQINSDSPKTGRKLYLGALGVDQSIPELKSDVKFDTLLPQAKLALKWLWYGPKDNTTGMHFDTSDNFFMQLYGQKRWLLSKPNSIFNLHPRSALSKRPAVSDFNPLKPDFKNFPKARKVKFYDVMMKPGTVLYIPPYWWHQVESCSTVISLNIWCKTRIFKAEWGFVHLLPLLIKSFPFFVKSLLGFKNK
ncbi:cupin-like domain-containing protein [Flavobacterium sp.]|jgi:hypothetical protein|uniref:cupin-like domain-containing protein n=1 Tax=Flavobacterium sp. TaxID=239 RepID=UPI0037BE5F5D